MVSWQAFPTTTNLRVFTDYTNSALNDYHQVDTVYTNYVKFFDKVDHNTPVSKLNVVSMVF